MKTIVPDSKDLNISTAFTYYTALCGGVKMPNITLSVPQELKTKMEKLPEVNWSETIREFLSEKVKRALLLKKLDKMLENSELTEEDCIKIGREAKKGRAKALKKHGLI